MDLRADANLMMGGDRNPCVYATVECIGRLNPDSNLAIGRMMEDFFIEHLSVRRERCVYLMSIKYISDISSRAGNASQPFRQGTIIYDGSYLLHSCY